MPAESKSEPELEIGHVLAVDIVGYSKLLIHEQTELQQRLNEIVRATNQFRVADAQGKLIRLPTGDGIVLVFFGDPKAPIECATEIATALTTHPEIKLRMGIHSGPVNEVLDVNERRNVAGAGIDIAQRVMDCGDAGHILLSKRVADDLTPYARWNANLHELGECEVKHGRRISLVNFYTNEIGNPQPPQKCAARAGSRRPMSLIALAALLLVLVGFATLTWLKRTGPRQTTPGHLKEIAVLPFKPIVPESRDPVLEMGMADTLIAKLSNSRELIVRSMASVRKYAALDQNPVTAGRELQVSSILEGNVAKSGDHIRVTTRLIHVADGSSLWSGKFDEKLTDVFAVQDAISEKVADALALQLSGQEKKQFTRRYTTNIEAYQLYLTGRYHQARLTPPEIKSSIGFFQRAIELDPNYALAYFGLAEAYRSLAITSDVASQDCLPQARTAAEKALQIDDSLAEAHASLAFIAVWYDWNWTMGEREGKRAIALNPNSAFAHFSYAHVLSNLGRHEEAIAEATRARELDPVFLLVRAIEGMFLHHAGRNTEAAAVLQQALELDQNFWVTHLTLGKVYLQQRKYADAITEFSKARDLSHGNSETIAGIAGTHALAGDREAARRLLEELKAPRERYLPPYNVALVYSALGEKDEALAWLDKSCAERDVRVTLLGVDPRWAWLRSDPAFRAILERIGLKS
jgi:TolB-like protein/Tfp pilus assembly protein PilF